MWLLPSNCPVCAFPEQHAAACTLALPLIRLLQRLQYVKKTALEHGAQVGQQGVIPEHAAKHAAEDLSAHSM